MLSAFNVLAKFKGLRGTPLDPFGYSAERKLERQLIADYEAHLAEIVDKLSTENHTAACALAALPMKMRGFGHVKEANIAKAKADEPTLVAAFRDPDTGAASGRVNLAFCRHLKQKKSAPVFSNWGASYRGGDRASSPPLVYSRPITSAP